MIGGVGWELAKERLCSKMSKGACSLLEVLDGMQPQSLVNLETVLRQHIDASEFQRMVAQIEEIDETTLTVILQEYDEICNFVRASEVTKELANMKNYVSVVSRPYIDKAEALSKQVVREAGPAWQTVQEESQVILQKTAQ